MFELGGVEEARGLAEFVFLVLLIHRLSRGGSMERQDAVVIALRL
jgi:hypothetical protein